MAEYRINKGFPGDTVLVMINSVKRNHGNSNFFSVDLIGQIGRIRQLEFVEVQAPYVWYDINTGNCSICNINGTDVVIAANTYTSLSAVKSAIIAAYPSAVVTLTPNAISIANCYVDRTHLGAATLGLEYNLSVGVQQSKVLLQQPFVFKAANNYLTISFDGVDRTISISPGNYTKYDLCQALQVQVLALPNISTASVSFDRITGKITVSITTIASITTTIFKVTGLGQMLGFTSQLTDSIGSNPKVFVSQVSVQNRRTVLIRSLAIGHIHRVPVKVSPSDYMADSSEYRQPIITSATLQTIDFAIMDEDQCLLHLNGFDWGLSLLIETF